MQRAAARACLTAALVAGTVSAARAVDWHEAVAPHFIIDQERAFGAPGLTLNLEKIHNRLRMDLRMFSPWMEKERVQLYLYANAASYRQGEFQPPAWSNGLAYYDRRIIVVYDQPSPKKLDQIIAHEMTHLLFESYWGEAHKTPPHWLNEGLAMMEETEPDGEIGTSEWFRAMVYLGPKRLPSFSRMLEIVPNSDLKNKEEAALWYVEAYSVVYFLYRRHTRLQFRNFCENLRNGKSLQEALWLAYRYPDPVKFEAAWKDWLRRQSVRYAGRIPARAPEESPDTGALDEGGSSGPPRLHSGGFNFKDLSFHNLREDGN